MFSQTVKPSKSLAANHVSLKAMKPLETRVLSEAELFERAPEDEL